MNDTMIEDQSPHAISPAAAPDAKETVFALLFAISFSHMLNDTIQALLPAIYPLLKETYGLSFAQLGYITLTFQVTASLLQPLVGYITDKRPLPYSLPVGMGLTLIGLLAFSRAHSYPAILIASGLVGSGSAIFHPEASRIAHMAAGRRRGLAQSLFQVGGNAGSSIGPLLAAWFIVPHGQAALSWFSIIAMLGVFVLWQIGLWQGAESAPHPAQIGALSHGSIPPDIRQDCLCHGHPRHADLLQVRVPRQPEQLLHLLPHGALPCLSTDLAVLPLFVPLRRGRRHHRGRPRG
ncbi:MFS transporter [Prosthecobacter sp.]|uniref:MFS transporter n=1 Tax=Prosthecobacter sp. TaxID=1965333 RepID=UPI0037830841